MRRLGIELAFCVVALSFAAAPSSAVEYSQQDAQACTGDALRLCGYAIPDHERVRVCLFANQRSLSNACFSVIERARAERVMQAPGQPGGQPVQRPRYY